MKYFIIFIFIIYITTIYIEGSEEDRTYIINRIKKKLFNNIVLFNTLLVFILNLYCYTYQYKNKHLLVSLEKANFAMLISICAYLDIVIVPFWIVLYISFFFSNID